MSREVTKEMATGLVCLCGWCLSEARVALPRSALFLAVRLLGLPTIAVCISRKRRLWDSGAVCASTKLCRAGLLQDMVSSGPLFGGLQGYGW